MRTALNSRRILNTGTVEDVLALYPEPVSTEPVNGPDLERLIDAVPGAGPTCGPITVRYTDSDVENARTAIKAARIVGFLDALIKETKRSTGRKVRVTTEALLVAMWLAANSNRPMLLTEFADILFRGITPRMRETLGVRESTNPRNDHNPGERRRWNKAASMAVTRAFDRVCAVIDPSDENAATLSGRTCATGASATTT